MIGAYSVAFSEPMLPYALAFAAGAMIYVVFDDIVPEYLFLHHDPWSSFCFNNVYTNK